MLTWEKHKFNMLRILKDIYEHPQLGNYLGFKGGTACHLFYDLARYSVDLDFDLLDTSKKEIVYKQIKKHISKLGEIKDECIKRNTIFFLFSYGGGNHNIKIEISTRGINKNFEILDYFGLNFKVMTKEDIFANKLIALCNRSEVVTRDIFDIHFFLSKMWDINNDVIKNWTEKDLSEYLLNCIKIIKKVPENKLLQGLGELVDEKQKYWIKNKMKDEVVFNIRVRIDSLNN